MPKIAIFMNSLAGGGMERGMLNLAKFYVGQGVNVDMLVASAKGPLLNDVPEFINLIDLKSVNNKKKSIRSWLLKAMFTLEPWFFVLFFARKLPKAVKVIPELIIYLNEHRPDAVISTPTTANLALLWAQPGCSHQVKIFVREASTLSEEIRNKNSIFFQLIKFFVKKWYKRSDKIICVSDGVRQDLNKSFYVPSEKLQTIYNILDIEGIKNKAGSLESSSLISSFGEYVLSIGRLEKQKDFVTLIRAFHLIANQVSLNLVILGEGSKRSELERLVKELSLSDRVYLPGFINNPYPILAKCKLFALSSRWEGCPNVLREALVLDRQVISTDCAQGVREILAEKDNAAITPVGDYEQYAKAMLIAIKNGEERISKKIESANQKSKCDYMCLVTG